MRLPVAVEPVNDTARTTGFSVIAAPIDFLGVNYYSRGLTKHDTAVPVERASRVKNPAAAYTENDRPELAAVE